MQVNRDFRYVILGYNIFVVIRQPDHIARHASGRRCVAFFNGGNV